MSSLKVLAKYPPEWCDDQVMDVMFAPFRDNRNVNPRSWDSKLHFWVDMVRRHCINEKVLCFNARQLPDMFERGGKVPACMNIVLSELVRLGTIQPFSNFSASSGGWVSWSVDILLQRPVKWCYHSLVKQPLSWAYSRFVGSASACQPKTRDQLIMDLPDENFVFVELVKDAAESIYQRHCSSVTCQLTDNVINYHELARSCRDLCADDRSFDVALMELQRQRRCIIGYDTDGEKIIRMVSNKSEKINNISDTDMKIYRLKTAEAKLEQAILSVTKEIEECRLTAKAYLQQGKKSLALKCLRRKKLLETRQTQHEQAIDKINSLLNMLQQTESQKQVLDAYSSGVKAFKDIQNKYGLTEDSIDDTMIKIQEVFDDNEMINQSMAQPIPGDVDDSELENELDELLAGRMDVEPRATPLRPPGKQTNQSFDVDNLPDVPLHEPHTSPVGQSSTARRHRPVLQTEG